MKKSVILLLVISLVAGCGKGKQLVSPLDPPAGTQSGSETQSEETTEKQQEETKCSWLQWGPTKFVAKWTLIAAAAYGLYKLTRYVLGEEEWNRIMNPEHIEEQKENEVETQQPSNNEVETISQQNEAINQQGSSSDDVSDESSTGSYDGFLLRGEGTDNSIRNERIALDAEKDGRIEPPLVYKDVKAASGKPTRLLSKFGNTVKIEDEDRYRAYWEKYKRKHYPNHKFD